MKGKSPYDEKTVAEADARFLVTAIKQAAAYFGRSISPAELRQIIEAEIPAPRRMAARLSLLGNLERYGLDRIEIGGVDFYGPSEK